MKTRTSLRASMSALVTIACAAALASSASAAPVGMFTATATSPAGTTPVKGPPPPAGAFVDRPTIPMTQYKALRQATGASSRPGVPATPPLTVTTSFGFNGVDQPQCGCAPSDSNGAVGGSQIAEVVNVSLATYNTAGSQTSKRLLSTVTGYSASGLTDPRILYDSNWKRFSASVLAFPTSTSNQPLLLMFSKSATAAGSFWVYNINMAPFCGGPTTNPFFDYPQIGQTQDAVIVTGSCFQGKTFVGARIIAVAKALVFNGKSIGGPVFSASSSDGTVTPANVYDQNPTDVLITRARTMIPYNNPQGSGYGSLGADTAISGFQALAVPRSAGQAGCTTTSCHLDTSDGRFVQDSTQFGDQLWNVATYGFAGTNGSFATPYWGQFSISGHSTTQFGSLITDSCSDDFNASLVVSTADKMWINWSSTDPQGSSCGQTFARQMEAGRLSSTPSGAVTNIINPFTSGAELTGDFDSNFGLQRWGDTSSMSILSATQAWSVNNSVESSSAWGTRIQRVTQ